MGDSPRMSLDVYPAQMPLEEAVKWLPHWPSDPLTYVSDDPTTHSEFCPGCVILFALEPSTKETE